MILLSRTPEEEQEHVSCPQCQTEVVISCIGIIDTLEKLRSLLDGELNTTTCATCGHPVTADVPLWVNMEADGLDPLFYVPMEYLELGWLEPEYFSDSESVNHTFYSRDELARQVHARIMIRHLKMGGECGRIR